MVGTARGMWRSRRRFASGVLGVLGVLGVFAVAIVTSLLVQLAGVSTVKADVIRAPNSPKVTDAQKRALNLARDSGEPVVIPDLTTITSQTLANPDGSLTEERAMVPVRARQKDGAWGPVDMTLKSDQEGVVRPTAAPYDLSLSDGGPGQLVRVGIGGKWLSLTWPRGDLPKPVLSGAVAVYRNVLPDVDLRVTATSEGFSEVLVVKTRAAAADPNLRTVRFTTATGGVRLQEGDGESFSAVDEGGAEVFGSGTPMMWDSTGSANDGSAMERPGAGTGDEPETPRRAPMPLTVDDDSVEVTPDKAMMTGESTVFPVFIDPSVSVAGGWTMINHSLPDQSYYSYDRSDGAKVGYSDTSGGVELYRSVFRFGSAAKFAGKHILNVNLSITITHSWSCSASSDQLYLTGPFGAGTTWRNHAGTWSQSLTTAASTSCKNERKRVEFGGGQLITKVQSAANAGAILTLGMKSTNESTRAGWHKFDPASARLNVTYNSVPPAPSNLQINKRPDSCRTGESRPYVAGTRPVLSARVGDPDAGTLTAGIYYGALGASTFIRSIAQNGLPDGGTVQGTVPAGDLSDGASYFFQARANDGIDLSPWSVKCEFTVDATPPDRPPVVSSTEYPNDDVKRGGVGRTGRFSLDSGGVSDHGVNDVRSYLYSLTGCDPTGMTVLNAPTLGAKVGINLTPDQAGQSMLCVRSADRAGNVSAPTQYQFYVGDTSSEIAKYSADGGSGSVVVDDSDSNHPLTMSGGASWTTGHSLENDDRALRFDGATGYVASSGPVVAGSSSFSVGAWVKLPTLPTSTQTVLSQLGEREASFALRYLADSKRWAFTMTSADTDDAKSVSVDSTVTPTAGAWAYLVGVYDAVRGDIQIYVNGTATGAAVSVPSAWGATGQFVIGRGQTAGQPAQFLAGDVDDISVWDRGVIPVEIVDMLSAQKVRGQWALDEGAGAAAADSSGNGYGLTLSPGGATWTPGREGSALLLDGKSGHARTTGPVVRTDQSFTVMSWVRLDSATSWQTVLSQDGARASGFYLQYRIDTKKWAFTVRTADSDTAPIVTANASVGPTLGRWVHLTGVYDSVNRQLRIYVNGIRSGVVAVPGRWNAGGAFAVGRGKNGGVAGDWVRGAVDDVRAYVGIVPDATIGRIGNA